MFVCVCIYLYIQVYIVLVHDRLIKFIGIMAFSGILDTSIVRVNCLVLCFRHHGEWGDGGLMYKILFLSGREQCIVN